MEYTKVHEDHRSTSNLSTKVRHCDVIFVGPTTWILPKYHLAIPSLMSLKSYYSPLTLGWQVMKILYGILHYHNSFIILPNIVNLCCRMGIIPTTINFLRKFLL